MPDYYAAIFIKLIIYVWTVDSIVSILTIYYDFAHGLSRPNLIVLSCFLLDGIFLLPVTAPTRRDEIYLVAPGRDLRSTRHRCPATRSTIYKAPFQSSARNGARLLLPAAAAGSCRSCRAFMIRMKSATCQRMCCPRGERAVTVQ